MRYVEIHQQRSFFDNRKDIPEIIVLKIQTVSICIRASSTHRLLAFKNIKIWIFGGISKFPKLIVFGQILANFGNFGWFWADFDALPMADSMPLDGLKTLKPHNS
jgi:hypothetical protein